MPAIKIFILLVLTWLCSSEELYPRHIYVIDDVQIAKIENYSDTLNKSINFIEKKIQTLKDTLVILEDQLEYLKSENTRYLSQKKERKKIEHLIQNKNTEISLIEFKLKRHHLFLTEARQIIFQPLDKQDKILSRLLDKINLFDKIKISKADLKNDLTSPALPTNNYLESLPLDCGITLSEELGILATKFVPFFSYTPANLEAHFKDREFVESEIRLLRSSKKYFLEIRLTINTAKAQKTYGLFEAGNPIKMIMLDGTFTYLNANAGASGQVDEKNNTTTYQIQCPLSHDKIKLLKNKNPDRIIIIWEGGLEDYEIYHMDAIQNLIKCME